MKTNVIRAPVGPTRGTFGDVTKKSTCLLCREEESEDLYHTYTSLRTCPTRYKLFSIASKLLHFFAWHLQTNMLPFRPLHQSPKPIYPSP